MEEIIEVNPVCRMNSLLANLTISNDFDQIKVAQEKDKELLTSMVFSLLLTLSKRGR